MWFDKIDFCIILNILHAAIVSVFLLDIDSVSWGLSYYNMRAHFISTFEEFVTGTQIKFPSTSSFYDRFEILKRILRNLYKVLKTCLHC